MTVKIEYIQLSTEGNADVIDITSEVEEKLKTAGLGEGLANISVIGSTGAVTTCEFEPGLVEDIGEIFDKLIPSGHYNHDEAWGDGNGHSHLRSSMIGPSLTVPFDGNGLILGV